MLTNQARRCFQLGEGPSRGLLRDYEPSDGTFWGTSHLATVVMFTWAPPHPATSGSHKLLADLLTPGHRNMRGKSWNSPKFVAGSSPRLPGKHLVSHLSFSKFGFWWGTTTLPSLQYYKTNTILHNDDKEDNISLKNIKFFYQVCWIMISIKSNILVDV